MSDTPVYTVEVTASDVTDPPTISVNQNPLGVDVQNALLVFQLVSSGFEFPEEDAIVVTNPGDQFPNFYWIGPTQVGLRDRCTVSGNFDYTITVLETSTGRRHKVDPTIINEV